MKAEATTFVKSPKCVVVTVPVDSNKEQSEKIEQIAAN